MRIMALDVGDRTIGVAVTDEMGWSAQGIATIRRSNVEGDVMAIAEYVNKYNIGTLVVGLPLKGDEGEVGLQAAKVLRFVEGLRVGFESLHPDLKIETWDESMTTGEAHEVLSSAGVSSKKRRKVIDKLAAVFILESYMRR